MTDQEKRLPRFYTRGQIVLFSRDDIGLGVAQDRVYRVAGIAKDGKGRQLVRLSDENDRTILWDPRLGRTSRVNIFNEEHRDLAKGDRIQWRLVDHALGIRNADRGTVEKLTGRTATILWDRDGRRQEIDLTRHKNWDHGYAETVYSAQSKTYDRVYVLAPVGSSLVTGKNYYTAITRARFGVKLWTESADRLIEKLERNSGTKTSALEGLGRLAKDSVKGRAVRHGQRWDELRLLHQWLQRTLWGLRDQEGGWIGAEILNTDGSYDLGPMQVNSWWVGRISRILRHSGSDVRHWMIHDACFNVRAARWIFLSGLALTGDYWQAVGAYHSPTKLRQQRYRANFEGKLIKRFGSHLFE
jgi:hypothetical protein